MGDNIKLWDITTRDGAQSLWALRMQYGMLDQILEEMGEAGFDNIELPLSPYKWSSDIRFYNEDPLDIWRLIGRKLQGTKSKVTRSCTGLMVETFGAPKSIDLLKLSLQVTKKLVPNLHTVVLITGVRDEIERECDAIFSLCRSEGLELVPWLTYGVSPRHTDELFANQARKLMKYKPTEILIKDVDGLLTPERTKALVPAIMREIGDTPLGMHSHGMSGFNEAVMVECMKLGVRKLVTCIPPLSNGSSHPNVFNVMHNAEVLGLGNTMNVEKLKTVEKRLTAIAKRENLPIGAPVLYDEQIYQHQVPGGVISTLQAQLERLGFPEKLNEVLHEIPHILEDLGYPIMITPHSQFIVTQAVLNIAAGERYKDIIDAMIEYALGVYGEEDCGPKYMNQNIRDNFLSRPNAKRIAERYAKQQEESMKEISIPKLKQEWGMGSASDEEFLLAYIMHGQAEIKKMRESARGKYQDFSYCRE